MDSLAIGLPSKLDYALPKNMPSSSRSWDSSVQPDGVSSVVSATPTATAFVINNTGTFGAFNQSEISFSPPSGMGESIFLNTEQTTLNFTLTYNVTTASVGATGGSINLISSAASFIDNIILYAGSNQIEQIQRYDLLQHMLLATTVSSSQRYGISCMGVDVNSNTGTELASGPTGAYRYNFSIPLISLIGVNTSDKLFPIGSVAGLVLKVSTSPFTPFVSYCTAITTQPVFSAFTLSEFSLNLKYVDIGESGSALMKQTLVNGMYMIKAQSYINSSVTIPNGSSGATQLSLQIRKKSVKSLFAQIGCSQGVSTGCPNGLFDAINCGINQRQLSIGGFNYPQKALNDVAKPAEGFTYLMGALGQSLVRTMNCMLDRVAYNTMAGIAAIPTGADSALVLASAGSRPSQPGADTYNTQISKSPSVFFMGTDLEKVSGCPLFCGINTLNANPYLNLTLAAATNVTLLLNSFALYDVVLVCDVASKTMYSSD